MPFSLLCRQKFSYYVISAHESSAYFRKLQTQNVSVEFKLHEDPGTPSTIQQQQQQYYAVFKNKQTRVIV